GSRGSPQERSPVDLRDLIQESIAFATKGRSAEGIEIVIEETAPRHTTLANREALRGVFVNLINNALEASPASGRILIKIGEETPGTIRLDFTDSGSGIPPAIRETI